MSSNLFKRLWLLSRIESTAERRLVVVVLENTDVGVAVSECDACVAVVDDDGDRGGRFDREDILRVWNRCI